MRSTVRSRKTASASSANVKFCCWVRTSFLSLVLRPPVPSKSNRVAEVWVLKHRGYTVEALIFPPKIHPFLSHSPLYITLHPLLLSFPLLRPTFSLILPPRPDIINRYRWIRHNHPYSAFQGLSPGRLLARRACHVHFHRPWQCARRCLSTCNIYEEDWAGVR